MSLALLSTARRACLACLSLLMVLALASSPLHAQRLTSQFGRAGEAPPDNSVIRVIVERFRGTRAGVARSLLVQDLTNAGFEVIPDAEVEQAASALGISGRATDTQLIELARTLRAAASIEGRVARARRAWSLVVRVRNGADASVLGSESWGGRSTSAIDGVGRTGAQRLDGYLRAARAPTEAYVAPQPRYEPVDEEVPFEAEEEAPAPSETDRYDTGRFMLSGGSLWRSLATTVDVYAGQHDAGSATPEAVVQQDRRYDSSGIGHAELGGEADIFPGAFGDQSFPYLGFLVAFRNAAFLSTTAPLDGSDETFSLPTNQFDLRIGVRGRYRVGPRRGDMMLFVDAGYALSSFTFGTDELTQVARSQIVPPMDYHSVEIGAGFDVAIVRDALSIALYGRGRIGVALGAMARNVWGTDASPANGFIVGLELRHDATWIARGAFASLRFEYMQFITRFRGQPACYMPTDASPTCDPSSEPWSDRALWELWPINAEGRVVGGPQDPVADHYFRWGLYAGYAFD